MSRCALLQSAEALQGCTVRSPRRSLESQVEKARQTEEELRVQIDELHADLEEEEDNQNAMVAEYESMVGELREEVAARSKSLEEAKTTIAQQAAQLEANSESRQVGCAHHRHASYDRHAPWRESASAERTVLAFAAAAPQPTRPHVCAGAYDARSDGRLAEDAGREDEARAEYAGRAGRG